MQYSTELTLSQVSPWIKVDDYGSTDIKEVKKDETSIDKKINTQVINKNFDQKEILTDLDKKDLLNLREVSKNNKYSSEKELINRINTICQMFFS